MLREHTAGWWALGIYAVFLATLIVLTALHEPSATSWQGRNGRFANLALALAYGLGGAVLFLGPLWSGAMAWVRERQEGTLESLLLTPLNSADRVQGRFWHILAPWAWLLVFLLPLYLLMAGVEPFQQAGHDGDWELLPICVFVTKPFLTFAMIADGSNAAEWSLAGLALVLVRLANDFTIVFFSCAAAYYISVRARSTAGALVGAGLAALGMLTVLSLHDWLLLAMISDVLGVQSEKIVFLIYGFLGALGAVVRVWLGLRLVRGAAQNFDGYTLGEKPSGSSV